MILGIVVFNSILKLNKLFFAQIWGFCICFEFTLKFKKKRTKQNTKIKVCTLHNQTPSLKPIRFLSLYPLIFLICPIRSSSSDTVYNSNFFSFSNIFFVERDRWLLLLTVATVMFCCCCYRLSLLSWLFIHNVCNVFCLHTIWTQNEF